MSCVAPGGVCSSSPRNYRRNPPSVCPGRPSIESMNSRMRSSSTQGPSDLGGLSPPPPGMAYHGQSLFSGARRLSGLKKKKRLECRILLCSRAHRHEKIQTFHEGNVQCRKLLQRGCFVLVLQICCTPSLQMPSSSGPAPVSVTG